MATLDATVASASSVRKITKRKWRRYHPLWFFGFIAPWGLGFIFLTLFPMIYSLAVSFTNFDGLSGKWKWIGFRNYVEALRDPITWFSLSRSVLLMVITVPLSIAGGLGLAILLNQRLRFVGILRALFYVPSVVPVVAGTLMWKFIFDRDAGALNGIIEHFGGQAVPWLIDPNAFTALIIVILWGLGGGMVISLAGLQGIPLELQEAALVDGANAWQEFRYVTLPMLSPILFFQFVTGVIASLQIFIQAELLGGSGQFNPTGVVVQRHSLLYMVHVWQVFFFNQRFGYGSALLWLFFLFILGFTLLIFRSSTFWVYYEVERN